MVYESVLIAVTPGQEADFEAGVTKAVPLFQNARGCRAMRLDRSVETPTHYTLVAEWDSVDDHMVHFRESPAFKEWRALVSPYFAAAPQMEHRHTVVKGF
ncbi:MAG: antibiotic biosynthesis monooxygenase [Rhizobiales bacterium 24-66-13]|jgi:heme-degrading monooxygenase HmoA|uniref:antibiotic biosynthesis monooxygenase family protein n=1 Tax=Roseixanthobacter finlandensis TaxID=3119922 RepID=UPI000BD1B090|nr:MAG: antibiotic biosynthesis monooxygenase [Rhizobiales bacterium 35-66-30]OYZ68211.1 MAG: antibiotic biosynthesis monooxygenase [Rhizobiales bacterium 24-66-13]OZB01229.1 MAG: antibiotic biosynthesis monooxygenase [Rhizobiales bacterium 39-66-18]HQS10110.1 antibiotic biosynthesis monooxygenase [Xanthobacteraceae bacterium]HQS49699.1 antibiotic biosynthesis monooxygenase [Xanthobacteraceae bacterium]